MTDKGDHGQNVNKEVQHSKTQANVMARRGSGQRMLHDSPDRLDHDQMVQVAAMHDQDVNSSLPDGPDATPDGFRSPKHLTHREAAQKAHGSSEAQLPKDAK